jgi:hypothetical protein
MDMDQPVSPKQPADADAPSKDRMTRTQVAERLGVSVSKVRTMEGHALHPKKVDGVNLFDTAEVEAVAKSQGKRPTSTMTEGQIAAAVFDLIDHGKELREIVIALEQPPALVRALYDEWMDDFNDGRARRTKAEQDEKAEREQREHDRRADAADAAFGRSMSKLFGKDS